MPMQLLKKLFVRKIDTQGNKNTNTRWEMRPEYQNKIHIEMIIIKIKTKLERLAKYKTLQKEQQ